MIPRIIHQTWKNHVLPERLREFQSSWHKHHPGWDYRLWNDEENEKLIAEHYPEFNDAYRRLAPNILKIDFVRLAYLHKFGGIYADLDCEAMRPLDDLMDDTRMILARELEGAGIMMRGKDFILNAMMVSPAGHAVCMNTMRQMIADYRPKRRFEKSSFHVFRMTIQLLDGVVEAHRRNHDDVRLLTYESFYPSPTHEKILEVRRAMARACGAYTVHHCETTWGSPYIKLGNKLLYLWQRWGRRKPPVKDDRF